LGLALLEAMRSTRPGMMEYELDAVAKFIFFRGGAQGDAYYSLIAGAPNAWYPHYHEGKRDLRDGELLLMDYAPDVGYYSSDVTRNPGQLWVQLVTAVVTLVFSLVGSFAILKLVDATVGLRVPAEQELTGLDLSQHNERAYS